MEPIAQPCAPPLPQSVPQSSSPIWIANRTVLSGDIFQRHVILGPRDESRAGAKLDELAVRVTRSGKDLPVPSDLEANTGEIVAVVQHVASVAAALGDGVCAGQFIICGSVTAPMFLETGETGIEWTLDPIGRASVDFAA